MSYRNKKNRGPQTNRHGGILRKGMMSKHPGGSGHNIARAERFARKNRGQLAKIAESGSLAAAAANYTLIRG